MARFEDMTPTRRRVRGPIYDLVELESEGRTFVALSFHDAYRRSETPHGGVRAILDFLELPMVDGIAPLAVTLPSIAVYGSGQVRTVRELIGICAEDGGTGSRAALELFVAGAEALIGAAAAARDRGLPSHGSLDPWQIGVAPPARPGASSLPKVMVLGYGLPAPDVADLMRDRAATPPLDRLRYMPPERLDGAPEDVRSDLYGLALICAELAIGRPVFDGAPAEVLAAIRAGASAEYLEALPADVSAVVSGVLSPRMEDRPVEAVMALATSALAQAEGRSLAEAVQRASRYLSDVEDQLPSGFRAHELLPSDPERDESGKRASAAAVRATAAITALDTFRRSALERIDAALPEVVPLLSSANQAMREAREAADAAREAGGRALRAPDRASAGIAEAEASAQAEIARGRSTDARQELERASVATADAWQNAADLKAETARTQLERAAELRDRLQPDERASAAVKPVYRRAREVARVVTSSRDPELQDQALRELSDLVRELEVLEARSLATTEAQEALARAEALLLRFGADHEDIVALVHKVRESARVASTETDGAAAQRAAERAVHAASQIEFLPHVVKILEAEAGQAGAQAEEALARAESMFSDVPHEEVEHHVRAARQAVARIRSDPATAQQSAAQAQHHAEEARRVGLEFETLRAAARVRAVAALQRASEAGAGLSGEAAQHAMQEAHAAAAAAAEAKLPAQASEAAARTEAVAAELERLAERVDHTRAVALNRAQAAVARAEAALGPADQRLVPVRERVAEIEHISDLEALSGLAEAVSRELQGLLDGAVIDDEVLEVVRQSARVAVQHAERALDHIDHDDARLHADAARSAVAEAEAATTVAAAELAAAEARGAAKAIEVVRAREALARAEAALTQAESVAVQDLVEGCRDASVLVEQAAGFVEAAEAAEAAEEAADQAVAAAEAVAGELVGFVQRAEASLADAEAVLERAGRVPAEAGLAEPIEQCVGRVRTGVEAARMAHTADAASRAVREAQEAASEAAEILARWERDGEAARARAAAAVEYAEEALPEGHVPGVLDAIEQARRAAGEAMSSEAPEEAKAAADRAEENAAAAHRAVSRHRQALAENIRRAVAAVQEAEGVLAESDVEGVRNALKLAREAAADAESADDVMVGEAAASTAEQAATAAIHAQERHIRQQLALHKERAADAAQRATEAASSANADERVVKHASAARLAAERAATAAAIAEARTAADAAESGADEALALVEGSLDMARHRATQAAERVQELVKEASVPSLRALMLAARQAAATAQRAATPPEAERAAERAEQVAREAQDELNERQRALDTAQERALGARNRAEESLTDPPLAAVMEAVREARIATEAALTSTNPDDAKRAADLADVAALRARTALEAQLSQLEVCRTRAKEALKRAEKALWEADLESIRGALKDARAGVRHAVNTEDLARAERGAKRAEQAAAAAEAALRERKEQIGALTLRAEEAVRQVEDARRITGNDPAMDELVEQARAAAGAVLRAVDPGEAEAQAGLAETAAIQARSRADEAIEARAAARRRAARAVSQAEAVAQGSDLPVVVEALASARGARAVAEAAPDAAGAMAAAERAEDAARVAEEAVESAESAVSALRRRAEAAHVRARSVLEVASGPSVEERVTEARRAAEAATATNALDELERQAEVAEAAADAAGLAAEVAQERCRAALEAADIGLGRAQAALATLDHDLVRAQAEVAAAAHTRARDALDPAEAEAAAEAVNHAAILAERAVGTGAVQHRAAASLAAVERATVSVPEGAPPQLVALADQVWTLVREVRHEAAAALEASEHEVATRHAERAAVATSRAEEAQARLQESLQGWRNDLKNQARTGLKALRGLVKRLQTVTQEIRALARSHDVLLEAERCDQDGLAAGTRAQEAARGGDPDGVRAGLNDLRKAMKRAQRVLERARERAGRRPPVSADLRRALQRAVEESGRMADEARRMLAGQPDSDAAWHAQRAMEAAQAARMTAKSALAGAASDEDITRVVQRLERALTALAHVRGGPVAVEGTSLQNLRTLQATASRPSTFESVGDPETVSDAPTMHDGLSTDLQENPDDEITHIAVRGSGQPLDG